MNSKKKQKDLDAIKEAIETATYVSDDLQLKTEIKKKNNRNSIYRHCALPKTTQEIPQRKSRECVKKTGKVFSSIG